MEMRRAGGREETDVSLWCIVRCPDFVFWLSFLFLSPSQIIKSLSLSLFIFTEISMTTLFFKSGARGGRMSAVASPAGEFCAVSGGSCFLLSKY